MTVITSPIYENIIYSLYNKKTEKNDHKRERERQSLYGNTMANLAYYIEKG